MNEESLLCCDRCGAKITDENVSFDSNLLCDKCSIWMDKELLEKGITGFLAIGAHDDNQHLWQVFNDEQEALNAYGGERWRIIPIKIIEVEE